MAAITVDGNNHVNFYDNRSELHDLRITGSKIETTVSSADLVLSAPGTGSVSYTHLTLPTIYSV